MMLPAWKPTTKMIPSPTCRGEPDSQVHSAVGRALSEWESLQSALGILFQLMCESLTFAANRAYGTVTSPSGRIAMLRAAEEVFFETRKPFDAAYDAEMKALFSACEQAQEFRNNIAHGKAMEFTVREKGAVYGTGSGHFLCPPPYAKRKVEMIAPAPQWTTRLAQEQYVLGASYFYTVADINYYRDRFLQLRNEVYRLAIEIDEKYKIIGDISKFVWG